MIAAMCVLGVILAFGLFLAADRLGDALTLALSDAAQAIREASESDQEEQIPRPSRTITAAMGTQLAYVRATGSGLEIGYAPVLAFVEMYNPSCWEPLAVVKGKPEVSDCLIDRVLKPGESLNDEETVEMKRQWREMYPTEAKLLEQRLKDNASA